MLSLGPTVHTKFAINAMSMGFNYAKCKVQFLSNYPLDYSPLLLLLDDEPSDADDTAPYHILKTHVRFHLKS